MPHDFPNFIEGAANIEVADLTDLCALFKGLEGRSVFPVSDALGRADFPGKTVVLRLDAEHGLVSGDLFHDPHDRNWIWSWKSEAIYKPAKKANGIDWDFAALCEVQFPEADEGAQSRHSKVVLVVRCGEHRERPVVADFRMALIDGPAKSQDVTFRFDPKLHTGGLGKAGFEHFSSFRRVNLGVRANSLFETDPNYHELMLKVFGTSNGKKPLEDVLSDAGLFVTLRSAGSQGEVAGIEYVDVDEEDASANTIFQSYWNRLSAQVNKNTFTYHVFLSAARDEPGVDEIPLGRTFGLEQTVRRSGSRRAAIIFPKEIVASYEAQYPDFELSKGKENVRFDEHMNRLAFRLKFTIVHELAHMLNLPHPWQRAAFAGSGMRSEPQALSWTNYGSLYPFGAANDHVFSRIENVDTRRKVRLERARLVMDDYLNSASFTPSEKIHLYHASHDRIAPGGRSFIDAECSDPKMAAPQNGLNTLELDIDGTDMIDDVPTVIATRYSQLVQSAKFQPLTGIVRLKKRVAIDTKPDQDYPFRFGSGSLFLLVRQEHPFKWPYNEARPTKLYEPRFSLINRRLIRPAPNLGVERKDRGTAAHPAGFCDHIYSAPLPLLHPNFLSEGFGGSHVFTFQALMIDGHGIAYHSNQILVKYERNDDPKPFGASTEAISTLLASDVLPGLADAVLYHEKSNLQSTKEGRKIMGLLNQGDIAALAKDRADLTWLAQLQAIVKAREFFNAAMLAASPDGPIVRTPVPRRLQNLSTGRILDLWSEKIRQVVQRNIESEKAERFKKMLDDHPIIFSFSQFEQ